MNEVDKQVIKEAVQEVIKDTVYEVIEPFVARMAKDYEENRRWMRSIDQRMDKLERTTDECP
jgi:ribosomal protein S17E